MPLLQIGKETKLKVFICFTFLFFLLELISGYYSGSVALIADAFHMLSDVAALFIALYATKLAKNRNVGVEFSFGLQRAEVVGALINGIALLALSFTLIIDSIKRFFIPDSVESPWLVLYVGSAGLVVNLVGLLLFHDHSHGGHGHSHSHEGGGHSPHVHGRSPLENEAAFALDQVQEIQEIENPIQLGEKVIRVAALMHERNSSIEDIREEPSSSNSHIVNISTNDAHHSHSHSSHDQIHHHDHSKHSHSHSGKSHQHKHSNDTEHSEHDSLDGHNHSPDNHGGHGHSHDLNMHGVFLHILGDLLASFGVIVSALVIIYAKGPWIDYVDPLTSLFITAIIISATVPLVRSACYILLQRTPPSVSVEALRQDILRIPGVLGVHELHVWQLSEAQTVASVHVVVPKPKEGDDGPGIMEETYMKLASHIKIKLHTHGVHSTTVQPEFMNTIEDSEDSTEGTCFLRCTSKACETKVCCPTD